MRAAIFIDGGYILNQAKLARVTLDWNRMAEHLLSPLRANLPTDLLRCYFYYCAPWMSPEPTDEEKRRMEAHNEFVAMVEGISRWQLRLGKLERRWDGNREYFEQKRVDVLLSCDLVRHAAAGHIQHAVLVAGDSDFIPAIAAAKESGTTVSLWCGPPNTVHKDVVAMADEVHQLNWARMPKGSLQPPPLAKGEPAASVSPVIPPSVTGKPEPRTPKAAPHRAAPSRSPSRAPKTQSVPPTQEPRHHKVAVDEEPGDGIGNVADPSNKRPRRRGSRGRRRPPT